MNGLNLTPEDFKKELSKYTYKDIYFLKSKWREWIATKAFQKFEEIDQKPNIQSVYAIFDSAKILSVENARNGFYAVRTKHSKDYAIVVIAKINNDRIEVMTYYKEAMQRRLPLENSKA